MRYRHLCTTSLPYLLLFSLPLQAAQSEQSSYMATPKTRLTYTAEKGGEYKDEQGTFPHVTFTLQQIEKVKKQLLLLVLGGWGRTGKSTLTNQLLGHTIEKKTIEQELKYEKEKTIIKEVMDIAEQGEQLPFAPINHDNHASTISPKVYVDKERGWAYGECPISWENTDCRDIHRTHHTLELMHASENVGVIICLEADCIDEDWRAIDQEFLEPLGLDKHPYQNCFLIVITKQDQESDGRRLENYADNLQEAANDTRSTLLSYILNQHRVFSSRIFVANPLNDGVRNNILAALENIEPLPKSELRTPQDFITYYNKRIKSRQITYPDWFPQTSFFP